MEFADPADFEGVPLRGSASGADQLQRRRVKDLVRIPAALEAASVTVRVYPDPDVDASSEV